MEPGALAQSLAARYQSLQTQLAHLEKELKELQEKIGALIPMPVYWRKVPCGPGCSACPHGPYPYLRVKREGKWRWQYLGKGWQPPEGFARPALVRSLTADYRRLLKAKERLEGELALMERLAQGE